MNPIMMMWLMGGNPAPGGAAPNPLLSFLPFVFIIAIMYFMMIRPQQKRQKEHQAMVSALAKGDKVITVGGIHGVVQGTKETTVLVKIADNVKVEIERSAVTTVVKGSGEASAEVKSAE
ncbi:preprotein translocase subunit YajC [bacterium]|nr:preprotein translocase subunit YajC [bacterium]